MPAKILSKISIILPVYKNQSAFLKTIKSLTDITDASREIIIIDSSPAPMGSELFANPGITYQHSKKRLFAGAARNQGAGLATRDWFYFLDSDCSPYADFFARLEEQMARHPDAAAFNGLVFYETPKASPDFHLHILEFHEYSSQKCRHPRFLHSGNLVIQKKLCEKVGGFRADIPMCTDFSFFAQMPQEDLKHCHYIPGLSITHQAHYVDPNKINEKLKQMGYWRGFVESQIPAPLQIHRKVLIRYFPILLPFSFLAIIIWRSLKLDSLYKYQALRATIALFRFCRIWAGGFWKGLQDGKSRLDPRSPS